MINTTILSTTTFIYLAAFACYLLRMLSGRESWGRLGSAVALIGLFAQTAALILRWIASYQMGIGHAPLSNLYESLIFFAWSIMALYLIVEWRTKSRSLGTFIVPVAFLCMAYASLSPNISSRIQPLIPALQSNWLVSHVVTCFLGYAAFTVAFAAGLMLLLKERDGGGVRAAFGTNQTTEKAETDAPARAELPSSPGTPMQRFIDHIPETGALDELIYQSAALGFVFLAIGIMTGSIWAHYAWGAYWSWDPKETWSLITWLVYAVLLHARYVRGWRGQRMAVMAIIGFVSVLITYLGVNYLPGLHSYQ
jgi:cytochrome c-type biogenesis protein CcsB